MNEDVLPPPASLVEKVTHYLHGGYDARAHGEMEKPPALGDFRWTDELILSTWYMASTGEVPKGRLEYRTGKSNGGFDRLDFRFLPRGEGRPAAEVDLSLHLGHKGPGHDIPVPFYGGGMSYGSVSENIMVSRARAAQKWKTFTCTGEGGYPPGLEAYRDHVITQVATGLFGVEERTIQYAPIVELKYAQGAKPGLGGHLLGSKSTTAVSAMRGSVPWVSLFSPFPFHSVYSIEDHKKHVDWLKTVNPRALISVKVSTPVDIDMVAVGSYYAGADVLHLDGAYGGTGAAPEVAKKNIAMPIELAVPKVHKHLLQEGIRDDITVMASGGIRSAWDVAKIIALGADGAVLATTELVAMGCTRCSNCERGRGCPFGLTTTDPELREWVTPDWGAQRLDFLYRAFHSELGELVGRLGLSSIRELRGRTDLLRYLPEKR